MLVQANYIFLWFFSVTLDMYRSGQDPLKLYLTYARVYFEKLEVVKGTRFYRQRKIFCYPWKNFLKIDIETNIVVNTNQWARRNFDTKFKDRIKP